MDASDFSMNQGSFMASSDAASDEEFVTLLKKLDLHKYFPGKMSRDDVLALVDEDFDNKKIEKQEDLCRFFLHRLLSCNYNARDLEIVTEKGTNITYMGQDKNLAFGASNTSASAIRQMFGPRANKTVPDARFSRSRSTESQLNAIHPLDVVAAVFMCSDPIIKQDIASLLWQCKLAIPFITSIGIHGIPIVHVWPLKSIIAKWSISKDGQSVAEEGSIISPPFLTIGFIRFQSDSVKKSQIINTIMSDTERSHPIFYHRNSIGSTKRRIISDGMVEISWYLPNGSEDNMCHEPVTVLNLRGNAANYPQQLHIVIEMVSICCIVCPASDLASEDKQSIIESIQKKNKLIIVVTYDNEDTKGMPVMRIENNLLILNTECLYDAKLKEHVRSFLKEWKGNQSIIRTSIETFSWGDISVDQNAKEIKDGISQAELVMKYVMHEKVERRKDRILPLHRDLWKHWVDTEIEIQRLKKLPKLRDIIDYRNEKEMEKVQIRLKQAKLLQNKVSEAILHFLKSISIQNKLTRIVCVRWLKIQLEKLSKKDAPCKDKAGTMQQDESTSREELKKSQEIVSKSHLGLEHLFRELGQIYEVIETQKPGERFDIGYDLPQLAATFILDGNSFEIFDGDVGFIPITWISAVFKSLSGLTRKLNEGRDPKCTVLTAYGMQSSGKSTLLNTMYGCQFAVSAGRCTRGVQIQMMKVNSNTANSGNVDYILLVDTEGVRSPDMTEELRRRRDNEITTFIVGLGQKTLINLMGENTSYLTDVLPIAVRAILRMESAGLHPSCSIVYQNVDSQSSGEMSEQNKKLQEELDTHTRSVCLMEKKEEKKFHDVINFNVVKDVHYIPSLWEGEKPMAPISQGYCKSTSKLKNSLKEFCKHSNGLDLSSCSLHVNSLWKAIIKDDFVYFFRNVLETEARECLDKFWCDLVWKLRMEASKCEVRLTTDIMNCPESKKLGKICKRSREQMNEVIVACHENLKTTMEDFFKDTPQKYLQYMCQWETSSIDGLSHIKEDLIGELKLEIGNLQLLKSNRFLVESKVKMFKDRIKEEVVALLSKDNSSSNSVQGPTSARQEMMNLFEEKWKVWMKEVKTLYGEHEQKSNITRKAVDILIEKFPSHKAHVLEKWKIILQGKKHEIQIQQSDLLKCKQDVTEDILTYVKTLIDKSMDDVEKRLTELTRKPSPYRKGSLEEIVQTMSRRESEIEALGVKLTIDFEIDLVIIAVSIAVTAFSENEKKFFDLFDPLRLLENEKKNFLILFETNYEKTSTALSFVRRVCEVLTNVIQHEIAQNIAREIADDMRSRVYMDVLNNKKSFLYTTLCQLAKDGIFSKFMGYIRNPTKIIEDTLDRYIDEYSSADGINTSKLCILLDRLADGYMKDIITYAKETKNQMIADDGYGMRKDVTKEITLQHWIKTFIKIASAKYMVNEIRSMSEIFGGETVDLTYFSDELLKQLKHSTPTFENLMDLHNPEYKEMKASVLDMLRRSVVGCTDSCPFCGEICICAQPDHNGMHETPVHRPQGCNGYKTDGSRVLTMASCQILVASEFEFNLSRTSDLWVPYKDYQTVHKSWKIPGDSNPMTSTFWEWFMITYIKDLEKEHRGKAPDLPDFWKTYTKEGEIEKLRKDMSK
ncbi:hypothetical protein CHS0354_021848 [Potamilus streckersoni]|uniref:VLIG-type G domain-containing protein n=1 Tax=Potamilus streckersoni TaxID=2493646 RepID=A0AAE0TEJ3_9BIVA|nr:hypothetical protein CHS0354_021848 [Potamilus streckersoni]